MDFEYKYSDEQQHFRNEVAKWLDENLPAGDVVPTDPEVVDDFTYAFFRDFHRKLGHKGWLYPTYPSEYGGGGLTGEHEMVINEELSRRHIPSTPERPAYQFSNGYALPSILVWGTEEQKEKYLKPLLLGETVAFQAFSEPQAGSDLASLESTAVRDGDDWIINGQKYFVSGQREPDLLFGPFMTDTDAPRHHNLGYFLIPYPLPGLSLKKMELLNGNVQQFVFFDNVRVSADSLLGGATEGWQVAGTALEQEHGGRGAAFTADDAIQQLFDYVRNTKRNGISIGADPTVQLLAIDSYIEAHVHRLLEARNFWMYTSKKEMTYEGSQSATWRREYELRNADRERAIMGPYALLGTSDPGSPFGGSPEVRQRRSIVRAHPGGTIQVLRLITARRLGISRTKERAAKTPATATSHTG